MVVMVLALYSFSSVDKIYIIKICVFTRLSYVFMCYLKVILACRNPNLCLVQ